MKVTLLLREMSIWVGALLLLAASVDEASADVLYWFSVDNSLGSQSVWRAKLDGSSPESVDVEPYMSGFAIDSVGEHIYWVSRGFYENGWGERVYQSELDGSDLRVLVDLTEPERVNIEKVRVDPQRGWIYFSGSGIWRVDVDGNNRQHTLEEATYDFVLDLEHGDLYGSRNQNVYRASLGDGEPEPLFTALVWGDLGMALDVERGKIYWAGTRQDLVVGRANLDGSQQEELVVIDATLDDFPATLVLDLEDDKMYFAAGGPIYRANLDGSGLETFHSGGAVTDLAVLRESSTPFRRGDCNDDGEVNVSDAVRDFLHCFGEASIPCAAACDTDGDGSPCSGVTDGVRLLTYLFRGGEPPPAPFPDCGTVEGEESCATTPIGCQ